MLSFAPRALSFRQSVPAARSAEPRITKNCQKDKKIVEAAVFLKIACIFTKAAYNRNVPYI
jgi:hypothetical protein